MTGIFSAIFGHALSWSGKIIYLSILLAIWEIFVAPYADGLSIFGMWLLNRSMFVMFSYNTMSFIVQVAIVISTFSLVMWVLSPPEHRRDHTQDKN